MTIENGTPPPRKTLTLTRKPAIGGTAPPAAATPADTPKAITRTGKRIITRDQLPAAKASVGKPNYARPGNKPNQNPNRKAKPPKPRQPPKPKKTPPSDLKARELNDRLNGFSVWLNFQPLSIGADKEIFRIVNDERFPGASKRVVQKMVAMHCGHGRYLQAVGKGGARFRLDGTEDGAITHYQQQLALERLAARLQGKG